VRKGDTLGAIANKYGSSTTLLAQVNNLGKSRTLRIGQTLSIPLSGVTPPRLQTASNSKPAAKTAARNPLQSIWYTVRAGDTLFKIASTFNTTVAKLKSWNQLSSNQLLVGKKLVVAEAPAQTPQPSTDTPRKVIHQVKRGETLDRIASTYNTSVDAIISWNESEDLSVIHPGDKITILLGDNN
jgi:LysM repeat protein